MTKKAQSLIKKLSKCAIFYHFTALPAAQNLHLQSPLSFFKGCFEPEHALRGRQSDNNLTNTYTAALIQPFQLNLHNVTFWIFKNTKTQI